MLLDCHLGATLKKCLIQISAINWCLRRKMIQQDLETQPFQRKCGSKLDPQKEWMQENTKLMIVQRELVSLSAPYSSEKNCQCWDRYMGYQKQQVYSKSVQKETVMVWFDQPSYHGQSACTLCLFPASLASEKGVEITLPHSFLGFREEGQYSQTLSQTNCCALSGNEFLFFATKRPMFSTELLFNF